MNPATPKTEPPPSTQLRKAVFGGARPILKLPVYRRKQMKRHQLVGMLSIAVLASLAGSDGRNAA